MPRITKEEAYKRDICFKWDNEPFDLCIDCHLMLDCFGDVEHPDYDESKCQDDLIELAREMAHESFNPNCDGTEEDYPALYGTPGEEGMGGGLGGMGGGFGGTELGMGAETPGGEGAGAGRTPPQHHGGSSCPE